MTVLQLLFHELADLFSEIGSLLVLAGVVVLVCRDRLVWRSVEGWLVASSLVAFVIGSLSNILGVLV